MPVEASGLGPAANTEERQVEAEISALSHLPTPLHRRPCSRPALSQETDAASPLYTHPSLAPISPSSPHRRPNRPEHTSPAAPILTFIMPDGSFAHPQQRQFNPYTDNGGTILAIAGADFTVIAGDTRQSEGYSIQTRYAPKVFRLCVDRRVSQIRRDCLSVRYPEPTAPFSL